MMSRAEFEKLVQESILDLPKAIRDKMDNVAVVIDDCPTPDQLKKGRVGKGSILLGLYEGVPKIKRGLGYNLVLPDKITIFQKNIEAVTQSTEEIKEQVKNTVWHEIAHHFGFDEAGAQSVVRKKRKS